MAVPPSQPVPGRVTRAAAAAASDGKPVASSKTQNLAVPSSSKAGTSPGSYGAMTGISFTNGGGFSIETKPRSVKWGATPSMGGGVAGSHGARYHIDGIDSPNVFSTSVTMDPGSFATSSAAFHLPPALSSSMSRRSYASAVAYGKTPDNLSTSLASMSMSFSYAQPHSLLSTSYSKSQVASMVKQRTDEELMAKYECCGQVLSGLHALVEHVEDTHPDGVGIESKPELDLMAHLGFSPAMHGMDMDMEGLDGEPSAEADGAVTSSSHGSTSPPVPHYPLPPSAASSKPSTPGVATASASSPGFGSALSRSIPPLEISDVLTSPPEVESALTASRPDRNLTRTNSTCSSPPEGSVRTPMTGSPTGANTPKIRLPTAPTFGFGVPSHPQQKSFERAFNEVVAGPSKNVLRPEFKIPGPSAVAPGLLFGSAVASMGIPVVPPPGQKVPVEQGGSSVAPGQEPAVIAEPALPAPSAFMTNRPWRCPNPGCNKSYKQSNGLKYHQQKGQCDFALNDPADLGLSVAEAEKRNRPYVCAVGAGCTKRYRQMNGLKYHYLNSGEHGRYGLRMLQNGTHPTPSTPTTPTSSVVSTPVSSQIKRPLPLVNSAGMNSMTPTRPMAAAPYAIPNRATPTPLNAPKMGVWPTRPAGPGAPVGQHNVQGPIRPNGAGYGVQPNLLPPPQINKPVPPPAPVTKGRDAVLFAIPSGLDPMSL